MNEYKNAEKWINSIKVGSSKIHVDVKAVNEIKRLLKRETPKNPITTSVNSYSSCYECTCGEYVGSCKSDEEEYHYYDYCPNCGQAIDWGYR